MPRRETMDLGLGEPMIKQESKYMSSLDTCKEVGEVFSLAEAWPEEVEMKGNLYDLILDQK